jgi:histidinol-phosphate/aromatic aminotransferase/cobyric acid decarboxylase-like protein
VTIPAPGAHGGDGARLARALGVAPDDVLDLSLSLNPFAPDLTALVADHAGVLRRYPDDAPATVALAAALGVDPDRVVLTNGGAEAIALVAAEHPEGDVDDPDFSLYRRHLRAVTAGAPRWRSNPNNPTGRLAAAGALAAVWDEAFYPLATGTWTRGDPGAIVVGSLTKVFACPGLRAGYVVAPDGEAAAALRARRPEWSVSSLACALVPELLAAADLATWAVAIAAARVELEHVLCAVDLAPQQSDANYVLVPDAPGLRDHLARRAVLVRDTASFGITDGVRVAVPDAGGLDRLTEALEGYR